MNKYVLPDLPYDYSALEPHISGEIVELHHDNHHAGYVEKANSTLELLAEARDKGDFDHIPGLERKLAFNTSGHLLHSLFWRNLAPGAGGRPQGELEAAIERDLNGFDAFRKQMIKAATTTMGSGWAMLAWEPINQQLLVLQIHDHQSETIHSAIPLMVLDAWEHAYYLQYRNQKKDYFEAVWNLWNWDDVSARYEHARALDLSRIYMADQESIDRAQTTQP